MVRFGTDSGEVLDRQWCCFAKTAVSLWPDSGVVRFGQTVVSFWTDSGVVLDKKCCRTFCTDSGVVLDKKWCGFEKWGGLGNAMALSFQKNVDLDLMWF